MKVTLLLEHGLGSGEVYGKDENRPYISVFLLLKQANVF